MKSKIKINKKYIWIILLFVVLIIADQVIKGYICNNLYNNSIIGIKNLINVTYAENTGGAYGIGQNSAITIIIANIIIIGVILKFVISKRNEIKTYSIISLFLIITGGIGNLIDRIFRGFVVDYIDVSPVINFPIFNFADILITVGIINLIISIFKDTLKKQETEKR